MLRSELPNLPQSPLLLVCRRLFVTKPLSCRIRVTDGVLFDVEVAGVKVHHTRPGSIVFGLALLQILKMFWLPSHTTICGRTLRINPDRCQ